MENLNIYSHDSITSLKYLDIVIKNSVTVWITITLVFIRGILKILFKSFDD